MPVFDLKARRKTLPEITYDSGPDGKVSSPIPYILTEKQDPMPVMLFIEEMYDTGEKEIGSSGSPEPIYDLEVHQYLNMKAVKQVLTDKEFDRVRVALGMKKLEEAKKEGEKILQKIEGKVEAIMTESKKTQSSRVKTFKNKLDENNKRAAKNKGKN
jgi:hypothetical protein